MGVWAVLTFPTLYRSLLEALLIQLEGEGCKNVSRCTSTSCKYKKRCPFESLQTFT